MQAIDSMVEAFEEEVDVIQLEVLTLSYYWNAISEMWKMLVFVMRSMSNWMNFQALLEKNAYLSPE